MMFHVHLAEDGKEFEALAAELRTRSQQERKHVFWAVALNDAIDRETVELFRSKEMLARKERETKGDGRRLRSSREEKRPPAPPPATSCAACSRRRACPAASTSAATTAARATAPSTSARPPRRSSARCSPRSSTASRRRPPRRPTSRRASTRSSPPRTSKGLPPVFGEPRPAARREGQDGLPRRERPADGGARPHRGARQLRRHGERPLPRRRVRQGAVRLGLRGRAPARPVAACAPARSRRPARGRRSTRSPASRRATRSRTTTCSGRRRSARRRASSSRSWSRPSEAFRDTFGSEVRELNAGAIVAELRKEVARTRGHRRRPRSASSRRIACRAAAVLDSALGQMKAILRGSEDNAIATFNACHRSIKDAIKRAVELEQALIEPRLQGPRASAAGPRDGLAVPAERTRSSAAVRGECSDSGGSARARDVLSRASADRATRPRHRERVRPPLRRRARGPASTPTRRRSSASSRRPAGPTSTGTSRNAIAAPIRQGMTPSGRRDPGPDPTAAFRARRLRVAPAPRHSGSPRAPSKASVWYRQSVELFRGWDRDRGAARCGADGIREECARLIGAGKKVIVP